LLQGVEFGPEFKPHPIKKLHIVAVDTGKTNRDRIAKVKFRVFSQIVIFTEFAAYFVTGFSEITAVIILGMGPFPRQDKDKDDYPQKRD
jgi:hypothetical protein